RKVRRFHHRRPRFVKERLKRASAGERQSLLDETLEEVRQRPPPRSGSAQSRHEQDLSRFQKAAVKARQGSLKAATQLLRGSLPVPPGPTTDERLSALYVEPTASDLQYVSVK